MTCLRRGRVCGLPGAVLQSAAVDSPLALDAETMRAARLSHGRHAGRPHHGPAGAGRAGGDSGGAACAPGDARRRRSRPSSTRSWTGLERDVLPFVARHQPSRVPRVHPGRGHVARGARRSDRERAQRGHLLVARARRARARSSSWCSTGFARGSAIRRAAAGVLVSGGSAANLTALACAREARIGADGRAGGRLHVGPDPLVARARGAGARVPARPGARDPDRRAGADAAGGAAQRDRRGSGAAGAAADRRRERRHDRGRRDRPASTRSVGALPRARHLARTSTAPTARSRASPSAAARRSPGSSWPTRSRSTRTSGSISRSSSARCSSATARTLRRGFEISPDYLDGRRGGRREVNFSDRGLQLTRSCRALKLWISLRYFGVAAFRAAIDRCLDLALHAQSADRGARRARADVAGLARRRHVPPPPAGRRRRGRPRADQRGAGRARSSARARSSSRRRACAAASCCASASSTTRRRRPRSTARSSWRRRCRSTCRGGARARSARATRRSTQGWLGRPALEPTRSARSALFALARRRAGRARPARRARAPRRAGRGGRRAVAGQPRPLRRPRRRRRGRRGRQALATSGRASSSASWRPSTGEQASRVPARRRSPPSGRRGCSSSTGCSSTG